jgi:hypothetical protein
MATALTSCFLEAADTPAQCELDGYTSIQTASVAVRGRYRPIAPDTGAAGVHKTRGLAVRSL